MMAEPRLAAEVGDRFDHVLVDEYQDTNRLQANILRALKPDGRGVTVVGDDAQSIYSFRAATVRNILDFPAWFTTTAEVVTLERNYRSTQPILDASNAVIALASRVRCWTIARRRRNSSSAYAMRPTRHGSSPSGSGAVARPQVRRCCGSVRCGFELARRDIPFVKYGGSGSRSSASRTCCRCCGGPEKPRRTGICARLLPIRPRDGGRTR
jgi:DNA helicase-2/ATP-dependent DNA helicase PcrA